MNSILNIIHIDPSSSNNRNYQEFKLFVQSENVKAEINSLRAQKRIVPVDIKRRVEKYLALRETIDGIQEQSVEEAANQGVDNDASLLYDIQEKNGFQKLEIQSRNYIEALHSDVHSKISIGDVEVIIKKHDKPFSWVDSLAGYILTGVLRSPVDYEAVPLRGGVRLTIYPGIDQDTYFKAIDLVKNFKSLDGKGKCKIYTKNNSVILELSGKVAVTTLRKQYTEITKLCSKLCGSRIKNKRKKKLDEHYVIASQQEWLKTIPKYDTKGYKDPATGKFLLEPLRAVKKEELIEEGLASSSEITDELRKREDARHRQILKRNKHRIK